MGWDGCTSELWCKHCRQTTAFVPTSRLQAYRITIVKPGYRCWTSMCFRTFTSSTKCWPQQRQHQRDASTAGTASNVCNAALPFRAPSLLMRGRRNGTRPLAGCSLLPTPAEPLGQASLSKQQYSNWTPSCQTSIIALSLLHLH